MSLIFPSSNDTALVPSVRSNGSSVPFYLYCYVTGSSSLIYFSFLITNICILLPVCTFVLHCGHQRRQLKLLFSSSAALSHSDCFTFHLVAMEMIGLFGCGACAAGIHELDSNLLMVGNFSFALAWFGETFFHVLTCLELYLAAVHPVSYRNRRNESGVRIRNASVGCVWLFCLVGMTLVMSEVFFIVSFCLLVLSLAVVAFCSVSVLCVLVHPGPGETSKDKEKMDQTKQRAFNMIAIILGVLLLRFSFNIAWEVVYLSVGIKGCVIMTSCTWFNIPCSLVLPLLFLHRAGRLACSKSS